jgi:hypothetical protein
VPRYALPTKARKLYLEKDPERPEGWVNIGKTHEEARPVSLESGCCGPSSPLWMCCFGWSCGVVKALLNALKNEMNK